MNHFFKDVWHSLNTSPKYLESKYFYNETGDRLFQQIMDCPEYYLTRCELEIFSEKTDQLIDTIKSYHNEFDIVELGAGDAMKSSYLLRQLLQQNINFTYYPIDISQNVISQLHKNLPKDMPGLKMQGLNGEYFDMLERVKKLSKRKKIVLFLGSSIGNIPFEETTGFLHALQAHLMPGDLLLTGFDLKKDPATILAAYNDKSGITRDFNLNLLRRINEELDANFNLDKFIHAPVYDEISGACKSYLLSTEAQQVCIGEENCVQFEKDEAIYMEISQKYTLAQTDELANSTAFKPLHHFFDSKEWFVDALWQCT